MRVRMRQRMRVRVGVFPAVVVAMDVVVAEIAREQQVSIRQDVMRRALCDDVMGFVEHVDAVGDGVHDAQIMRSRDNGVPGAPLFDDEVHEP